MQVDFDHVLDGNEIALLLAIGVAVPAPKQLDPLFAAKLVEEMERDRGHAPLVRLVRPVDVEIAKARDLAVRVGQAPAHDLVEQELGIAVDVERRLVFAFLAKHPARAVDRGGRRVQERHLFFLAVIEQRHRIAVVVLHHVAPVRLHRVGAGALVQHCLDRALEFSGGELHDEVALVDEIGDFAAGQVQELVGAGEVVHRDDIHLAALVQRADQVGSDESGRAGDYVVHAVFPC